ncbi:MAG: sugar phosphate isomerase/epimerase family protein [Planctomycetota bacterium]
MSSNPRRDFLRAAATGAAGFSLAAMGVSASGCTPGKKPDEPQFRISLAQWSLHRMLGAGDLSALSFPEYTRNEFGIEAVEYVNSFFKDKARDQEYLGELRQRATDNNVRSLLIMVDGEGRLGDPNEKARRQAVENHVQWLEAAAFLGCHSIRVNAASDGGYDEQAQLAADGLHQLAVLGAEHDLNVIVENHGGLSSNGAWLAGVIETVDHPRCGTLPDFGNFHVGDGTWYDRYKGVTELMPFAKAVSAKSNDFNEAGDETNTDYRKMMQIVLDAGYRGYVGIEYEGATMSEYDGIRATHALLQKVRAELST